jgi:DNA-binding ferritin-like protein
MTRARTGSISSTRGLSKAITTTEDPDPVTQDMLIERAGQLEQFHWFVRAG